MRVHYEFDTLLPPHEVVAALIDFSDRRRELWPNLDASKYRLHEQGDTWAIVTEGNRRPDVWARERYDWSVPGRVSWTVLESNFCAPGSNVAATVSPGPAEGSHVAIDWERHPIGPASYVMLLAVRLVKDRALGYREALDRLAHTDEEPLRRAA